MNRFGSNLNCVRIIKCQKYIKKNPNGETWMENNWSVYNKYDVGLILITNIKYHALILGNGIL